MTEETQPFIEHLEALRDTLIRIAGSLLVGMCIAGAIAPQILHLLKMPLAFAGKDPETFLIQLNVVGGLSVAVQVMFWGGLLFASPAIIGFITAFIFPGLLDQEKKAIASSSLVALLLFITGVILGFFCIQYALVFMFKVTNWIGVNQEAVIITDYISFVLKLLLGFGAAFEFPVVVYILGVLGIVEISTLREKRKFVFVIILFVSMMLTPQDPFTMLIMAVPIYLLYEVCILLLARRPADEDVV